MVRYSQESFYRYIMFKKFIPPLPFLLILAVFLTAILITVRSGPNLSRWESIKVLAILSSALVLVIFIYKKWMVATPTCSLFYGPMRMDRYDIKGNLIGYEDIDEKCGKKSVGRVKVLSARRGGSTEYFCEGHHPEIGWMKRWLEKQGIMVYPKTIKMISTAGEDDNGGPDLTLRFF